VPAGLGELLFGFRQCQFGLRNLSLGELGLFPGATGSFLRLFAPALGQARLFSGRLPLVFGFRELNARKLDLADQLLEGACGLECFH
jgi:hypothetical protein